MVHQNLIYTYLLQSVFHDPQLLLESHMLLLTPMDSEVRRYTTYIITVEISLFHMYYILVAQNESCGFESYLRPKSHTLVCWFNVYV